MPDQTLSNHNHRHVYDVPSCGDRYMNAWFEYLIAHFTLPEDDDGIFKRVEFVELGRTEAEAIVAQYNEEAKAYYDPHAEEKRWKLQQEEHSPIRLFAQEEEDVDDEEIDGIQFLFSSILQLQLQN